MSQRKLPPNEALNETKGHPVTESCILPPDSTGNFPHLIRHKGIINIKRYSKRIWWLVLGRALNNKKNWRTVFRNAAKIMCGARADGGVITMRILILILVLLISGCTVYKPVPLDLATIGKDIDLPGMTREEIYVKSSEWIVRHLYSKGHIIDVADKNAGLIVAHGFIGYPATGKLEEIGKIQYTISFTMQAAIRDQEMTIVFRDLMIDIPKSYSLLPRLWQNVEYSGGYSEPVTEKGDYEAARKGLLEIVGRREEYLKRNPGE